MPIPVEQGPIVPGFRQALDYLREGDLWWCAQSGYGSHPLGHEPCKQEGYIPRHLWQEHLTLRLIRTTKGKKWELGKSLMKLVSLSVSVHFELIFLNVKKQYRTDTAFSCMLFFLILSPFHNAVAKDFQDIIDPFFQVYRTIISG